LRLAFQLSLAVAVTKGCELASNFYFDLRGSRTVIIDQEGIVAEDLNEAIVEALAALREMRASGELDEFGDGWKLAIRDDKGIVRKAFSIW
jgi:hypothetical protein